MEREKETEKTPIANTKLNHTTMHKQARGPFDPATEARYLSYSFHSDLTVRRLSMTNLSIINFLH